MKYYLAPLEGITTYIYRNAYHNCFRPMDKYFTPFIVPHTKKGMNHRELNDILPEHNEELYLVPQLLTNNAEDFIRAARNLQTYGYQEINLNLGCPSGTVVSKNKGAGFLAQPEALNRFLDEIFNGLDMKISIKTRIGKDSPEEFEQLLSIFNQYPLAELIIHPRIRQDFYKNKPNLPVFAEALRNSKAPVVYNGDIFMSSDYKKLIAAFPEISTVMLGRGIIGNPGLKAQIETGKFLEKQTLRRFHDEILDGYQQRNLGERNVLFKMKELWFYMIHLFSNNTAYAKRIKKSERLADYMHTVNAIFGEQELSEVNLHNIL